MVYINNKLLLVIKLEYFFKEGISKPTDTLKNAHQITNHQRNTNQNHNEISSHTSQGGYCPKKMRTYQVLVRMWRHANPHTLLTEI